MEHREAFIQMLRAGAEARNRIFLVLEQRHAKDLENGREGVRYYNELLAAVRDADVPQAVAEFQQRFSPLLDPDGRRRAQKLRREQQEQEAGQRALAGEPPVARWSWMATFGLATLLAMVIFWLIVPPPPRPAPPASPDKLSSPPVISEGELITGTTPPPAADIGADPDAPTGDIEAAPLEAAPHEPAPSEAAPPAAETPQE
jgi:hypothetical protein